MSFNNPVLLAPVTAWVCSSTLSQGNEWILTALGDGQLDRGSLHPILVVQWACMTYGDTRLKKLVQ